MVQLLGSGHLGDCSLLLDIMVAAAPVGIMDFGEALQENALGLIGEKCQASYALCILCALACMYVYYIDVMLGHLLFVHL